MNAAMGLGRVELDEHPPANIQEGEQFGAQVIAAVLNSPNWPQTVLFITYDEHGGFYDHVPPPPACAPDDIAPMLDPSDPSSDFPAQFDRYGFRVPLLVIGDALYSPRIDHTFRGQQLLRPWSCDSVAAAEPPAAPGSLPVFQPVLTRRAPGNLSPVPHKLR
jgi:phosphoesterase family protein